MCVAVRYFDEDFVVQSVVAVIFFVIISANQNKAKKM
jgi:hypothetical protein